MKNNRQHIGKGLDQLTRRETPGGSGVKPYSQNPWDHLIFSDEFAKQLHYYNNDNKQESTWEELIKAHPIMVLAEILNFDLKQINTRFNALIEFQFAGPDNMTAEASSLIYILAEKLDSWFTRSAFGNNTDSNPLSKKLHFFISAHLRDRLGEFKELLNADTKNRESSKTQFDFSGFNRIWQADKEQDKNDPTESASTKTQLKRIFYAFSNVVEFVKREHSKYAEEILTNGDNAPHIGLLVAFSRLMEYAAGSINNFTERHADYFFNSILRFKAHDKVPDKLFLLFNSPRGNNPVFIKKDTGFLASKDEERKDLIYQLNSDTEIIAAQVEKVFSLYFDTEQDIRPGAKLGLVTRIKKQEIIIENPFEDSGKIPEHQALFAQNNRSGRVGTANIGFAISDPILYLYEGNRNIHVSLTIDNSSYQKELDFSFQKMVDRIEEAAAILEKDPKEIFFKFINEAFDVSITTSNGILPLQEVRVDSSKMETREDSTLDFYISVDPGFPAICVSESDGYDLPTLIFEINHQANIFPYTLLQELKIEGITIEVTVSELKDLLVHNQFGHVDLTAPFTPFGYSPSKNSHFIVGNYEIAQKDISSLGFEIEWSELPVNNGGFKEYYSAYKNSLLTDDQFKVSADFLSQGKWVESPDAKNELTLFELKKTLTEEGNKETRLSETISHKNINCASVWSRQIASGKDGFNYGIYTKGGFFRLKLTSPDCAFGHKLYPDAMAHGLKAQLRKGKTPALPSVPYTPLINKITLNYRASSIHDYKNLSPDDFTSQSRFSYIHPFGIEKTEINMQSDGLHMLPGYPEKANLFIGLKSINPISNLALYVQLHQDTYIDIAEQMPTISWSYLENNSWNPINENQIVSDSTNGLSETGIVKFELPGKDLTRNTVLDKGLTWLKASVNGDLEGFPSLSLLHVNAAKLVWTNNDNKGEHLAHGLSKASILKPAQKIPGLNAFIQVNQSFGGKPNEDILETRSRIKERIYHKNRAVTAKDFELMLLQEFPPIFSVKCFLHTDTMGEVSPGSVLLVVMPYVAKDYTYTGRGVMVSNSQLQKVSAYAKKISADNIRIAVRNAEFEKVQIRCKVKFTDRFVKGEKLGEFERDIDRFLAPWLFDPKESAHLGKAVYLNDIYAFLSNLGYVEYLTGFSVLHVFHDGEKRYALFDSGKGKEDGKDQSNWPGAEKAGGPKNFIEPSNVWGTFIPSTHHLIEELDQADFKQAKKAGIINLQVEENFIIQ